MSIQTTTLVKRALFFILRKNMYMRLKKYREKRYFFQKLKKNNFDEREQIFLKHIVQYGDYCIDIGANEGEYSFYLAQLTGRDGKVFSFEPTKKAYKRLQEHYSHLRPQNVYIYNYAIGEKNGFCQMAIPSEKDEIGVLISNDFRAHFSIKNEDDCSVEEVTVKTLDSFVKEQKIQNLNFIKCDVEGSELQVFKGGHDSLIRFMPIVLCEIEERNLNYFGEKMQDIFLYFKSIDCLSFYLNNDRLIELKNSHSLNNYEIEKGGYVNNFFFIPKKKVGRFDSFIAR